MKNMSFIRIVLSIFLTGMPLSVFAATGTSNGGGGGGLCDVNGCKTLAQAGLRINDEYEYYDIESAVLNDLETVLKQMPYGIKLYAKSLFLEIIGEEKTFRLATPENLPAYKQFRNDYLNLIKVVAPETDISKFDLLAASDRETTYILPNYFGLDTRGKSLLLIHEYLVRKGRDLRDILRFDGVFKDYLTEQSEQNTWILAGAIEKVNLLKADFPANHTATIVFDDALIRHTSIMNKIDICRYVWSDNNGPYTCSFSREFALNLQKEIPGIARYLSHGEIWIRYTSANPPPKEFRAECAKHPRDKFISPIFMYKLGLDSAVQLCR
jgi:hypothetical protein